MSNFASTTVDLNTQRIGVTRPVVFNIVTGKKIKEIIINCDCLKTAKYDEKNQTVSLNFHIGDIPTHLKQMGVKLLPRTKSLPVIFEDGTREELFIKYSIKV